MSIVFLLKPGRLERQGLVVKSLLLSFQISSHSVCHHGKPCSTCEECQNYVRVLIVYGKKVFTCGTNAFSPVCSSRQVGNLSKIIDRINGVARCPYDPRHNSTAVITSRGELYAATVIDFSGRDPAIYRSLGNVPPLRTAQYNSKWLNGKVMWVVSEQECKDCSSKMKEKGQGKIRKGKEDMRQTKGRLQEEIKMFFKYRRNKRSCGTVSDDSPNENLTERVLQDAQRLFLMNDVVQPVTVDPYVTQDSIRFSKLVVDIVQGKDTLYHVMYIGTGKNTKAGGCCVAGLVGCLRAHVRYVGWNLEVNIDAVKNLTTNGRLGPWSPWQLCEHSDGDSTGSCMCRSRSCDSPRPRCGGRSCEGARIEVANCSRNGAWTPWSSWAPCSTSCGIGFQVRQRSCSNPAPRYGGRVCVGQSREERFCNENSPCPLPIFWSSWGPWNKCSVNCGGGIHSRQRSCENGNTCPGCAVEYKTCNPESCPEVRRNTPWTPWMPVNITQNGARQEQRFRYTCRAQLSDPHELQFGRKKTESRFCPNDGSAMCETDSLVDDLLKTGKTSARIINGGWSFWGAWSSCSRDCELGFRIRKRTCTNPEPKNGGLPCVGSAMEYQDCNPHPCPVKGSWSCWTPWSQCSATCGGGHYQRTRTCTNPAPSSGEDICIGLHTEEALCNTHPCEGGWSVWSEWSLCNEEGIQYRSRYCEVHSPDSSQCIGNSTQYQDCLYNEIPVILPASSIDESTNCGGFSLIHLIATGVSCFFGSSLLTFVIYVYCQRCQRQSQESTVIHPTTPNHLHYKGNTTPKNEKYTPMEFKVGYLMGNATNSLILPEQFRIYVMV
uniref:Sema domain-containing protein n=1 Tax=Pavo cristatus TaxID=9049 RepID=A0A8C9FR80_PAVCR